MNEEIDISKEKLTRLINISLNIDEDYTNLDVVLQKVLHSIELILDCESTSYLEYDQTTNNLFFRFASGEDSHLVIGLAVPQGKGIAHKVLRDKKGLMVNNTDSVKNDHYADIDGYLDNKTNNILAFPVFSKTGAVFGVVEACNKRDNQPFTKEDFQIFSLFCQQAERSIRHAQAIADLKKNIAQVYKHFESITYPPFIYTSKEMKQKIELAQKISNSQAPVLITGECGSGKRLLAHHIHTWGKDEAEDYKLPIIVNCTDIVKECKADISELEKLFFGVKTKKSLIPGYFLKARNNTIILSEITALPLAIQEQIYNCIQYKKILLHSSSVEYQLQSRIICTSSDDLEECVNNGEFLENLYLQINTLNIYIPPLSSRPDDIVAIAKHYISHFIREYQKNIIEINPEVYTLLRKYGWPHSVNELILVISRSILALEKDTLDTNNIVLSSHGSNNMFLPDSMEDIMTLKEATNIFKKDYIYNALIHNSWNCTKTAKILDIQRSYLSRLVKSFNLKNRKNKLENT